MTNEEVREERGQAFTEREELTAKADCLRHRLRTYGRAFHHLADQPFDPDTRKTADRASDLREDWADLRRTLDRVDELSRFLDLK